MFIQCGLIKGTGLPEMEDSFYDPWEGHLVPLLSAFSNILELRFIREIETDDPDTYFHS